MANTENENMDAGAPSALNGGLDKPLYRCGYCGGCTDSDGNPIDWYDAGWDTAEPTQGLCCAGQDAERRMIVTREMAMDAQMPDIEGRSV